MMLTRNRKFNANSNGVLVQEKHSNGSHGTNWSRVMMAKNDKFYLVGYHDENVKPSQGDAHLVIVEPIIPFFGDSIRRR